jgi:hypothetical protein
MTSCKLVCFMAQVIFQNTCASLGCEHITQSPFCLYLQKETLLEVKCPQKENLLRLYIKIGDNLPPRAAQVCKSVRQKKTIKEPTHTAKSRSGITLYAWQNPALKRLNIVHY